MLLCPHHFIDSVFFFFFNDTATTEIYTLSLHDALPTCGLVLPAVIGTFATAVLPVRSVTSSLRSEEHTSELQSQSNLVCRLLLEKKKKKDRNTVSYLYQICYHTQLTEVRRHDQHQSQST